jgi:hypothetical protein
VRAKKMQNIFDSELQQAVRDGLLRLSTAECHFAVNEAAASPPCNHPNHSVGLTKGHTPPPSRPTCLMSRDTYRTRQNSVSSGRLYLWFWLPFTVIGSRTTSAACNSLASRFRVRSLPHGDLLVSWLSVRHAASPLPQQDRKKGIAALTENAGNRKLRFSNRLSVGATGLRLNH